MRDAHAAVVPVGVLPDGQLQLPEDPKVVGWWAGGAAVGSMSGAIVIAGHVDSHRYGLGTFSALIDAQPGDVVELADSFGRAHRYVVSDRQQQPKEQLPSELFAADGPHRLVLITCGGSFDDERRRYADNVVVIAEPA